MILRIIDRGLSREAYDAISNRVQIDLHHPLGLIMHGASETDGVMQIAQVWESEEYANRYDEEVLRPVLEALGAPLTAEIRVVELHHLVTP